MLALRLTALRLLVAALLLPPGFAAADPAPAIEWSGSGFLTLAAGRVFSGRTDPAIDQGYRCPCFISDYAQAGVYESGRIGVKPGSRLGLQGSGFTENKRFGVTGQVVFRGTADGAPDLEWIYGTWEVNSRVTVQAGRKRLPLFAYSEVQDVGFAIPWVHLPPQLYGWEVVNYNGASVQYRDTVGDWSFAGSIFGGGESRNDAGYWRLYNGRDSRTDSRWSNIVGADAKVGWGPFEARYVHMQSDTQNRFVSEGDTGFSDPKRQRIHGVSLGYDQGGWFARIDALAIDRTADYGRDRAQLYSVGRRSGHWTALVSRANYRQLPNEPGVAEAHFTNSAVLRYDLTHSSAVKLQLDVWRDRSEPGFASIRGDAKLVTIAYERVF